MRQLHVVVTQSSFIPGFSGKAGMPSLGMRTSNFGRDTLNQRLILNNHLDTSNSVVQTVKMVSYFS
jgi:hypothetical protein